MVAQAINRAARAVPTWPVYALGLLPGLWFWWLGLTGGLGAEPIKALEQELGKLALQFLIACLAVTPLRRFAGVNLLRFRRALGLVSFFYVLQHLSVWLLLDIGDPARIWADIVKRPYITIGMAGFAMLLPLALTSTDGAVRRMGGAAWRRLHRLSYPALIAGAAHYLILVKGWPAEPIVYAAIVAGVLGLRVMPRRRAAVA